MKLTKSRLKEIIREELKLNETEPQSFEKIPIPASIKRRMDRFIGTIKDQQMNKTRKLNILLQVTRALGISARELAAYGQLIRKGLKK